MRVQDLRDSKYEKNIYFSHKRGWLKNFRWEYCINRNPFESIAKFKATLGGNDSKSFQLSVALLGFELYLTFEQLLPNFMAVGWFERNGVRNPRWHEDSMGREYGFYIDREVLRVSWGNTIASGGSGYWHWRMPWTWTHVNDEVLTKDGKWMPSTSHQRSLAFREARKKNPAASFSEFLDRDFPDSRHLETVDYEYTLKSGEIQKIRATFYVDRMEWRWKLFAKLPFRFGPKKVRTCISVTFDSEVGEETGSWKGGTTGCGYEMLPGETGLQCLRRMERERKL